MEPSWPPLVPTWLRTLLTLLSPQGHCPGWARGVFLPTPCPVYLLLLQTQQGGVASSVESAQPRRGHEDTLSPSSRIVIVRKSLSVPLALACSQHLSPRGKHTLLCQGPLSLSTSHHCLHLCYLPPAFSYVLAFAYTLKPRESCVLLGQPGKSSGTQVCSVSMEPEAPL